jgi:hypothetical protein
VISQIEAKWLRRDDAVTDVLRAPQALASGLADRCLCVCCIVASTCSLISVAHVRTTVSRDEAERKGRFDEES